MAPESQEQTSIHGLRGLIGKTAHKTAVLSSLVAALFAGPASLAHASEMSDINKLMRAGQYAEALTRTDAVLAKHPRDAQLRFTKGLILAEQNRSAEAIAVFTKLTEDFPDLPEPYNNLAVLYAADGQYDKARAALDMAMRTNPTYATALENLGDVYAKLASQAYDKALQIDPGANVPQPKLTLLRSLNGNTTGGTVPRLASAASAQRDAKAKAEAAAAEQQERNRALAAEKLAQQAAADKAEAEKTAIAKATSEKEKAAADKAAAEKAAADKAAAEKAAADKAAADKAAAEKARAEKARAEQLAAEQARAQKAAADKAAAEQKQKELLAQKEKEQADKLAKEQAARAEKEKAAQAAAEKAKADKLAAAEKAKAEKLAAAEKAKADKARADKEKARAEASAEQDKTAVLAALNGWAKSWSDKDVRGYLGHYASDFETPRGASRKEWAEERRARIEDKGRISVKVSNAAVAINGNTATVRYRQIYNSDRLTVDSRKTLIFVKQGNRWLIKQERSGG
ncbi:signal peptide protein [Herbaspirillum rubrisubalbicans]|uniref:Signal peptide protein n=1 Tax=Herbaspirillum rubrisubalbicans TaxID=80842 RepID=A0ABX9C6L2_9BURK|nr:nuclear transport factor 2 family protein [Herbaspirillum rubrisubalbicans]RAM66208.1 signal peptide protein [Herbaspirillum rubrisubalbicans]RAN50356.1 signal peptide protein [Herbaspirillum rubrisubalbicans]